MKPGAPWSIKGVDAESRELAKARARDAGMTLGQWLNATISKADSPQTGKAAPPASTQSSTSALDTARVLRAVAEVARRVDTLQSERASASSDPNHLANLERTLAEISARVDEISMRPAPATQEFDTGRIEAKISTLTNQVAELQARPAPAPDMSSLDTAISALNNRVERLAGSVAAPAAADPELMTAVAALGKRLDGMADARGEGDRPAIDDELQSTLSRLSDRMDVLTEAANKSPAQPIVGHNADPSVATAAAESLDEQNRNIIKLMNGMVNIAAKVDGVHTEVEERVAPLDTAVTALKADLARGEHAATERVAPIEEAVHEIRQAVQEQAAETSAAIAALQMSLQELSDQQRQSIVEMHNIQAQAATQNVAPVDEPESQPEQTDDHAHGTALATAAVATATMALTQDREPEKVGEVPVVEETHPAPAPETTVEEHPEPRPPSFDDLSRGQNAVRAASSIPASEIFQDFGQPAARVEPSLQAEAREDEDTHRPEPENQEYDQPDRPATTIPVTQLLNPESAQRKPEPAPHEEETPSEVQTTEQPPEQPPVETAERPVIPPAAPDEDLRLNDPDLNPQGVEPDPHMNAAVHMRDPRNAPYMRGEYREPRFRVLKGLAVILLVALILAGIVLAFISLSAPPNADSNTFLDRMGRKIEQMFSPSKGSPTGNKGSTDEQSQNSVPADKPAATAAAVNDNGDEAAENDASPAIVTPAENQPTQSNIIAKAAPKKKPLETLNEGVNQPETSEAATEERNPAVAAVQSQPAADTPTDQQEVPTSPVAPTPAAQAVPGTTVDEAAKSGDADAQFAMGERFKNGDGVKPSYQRAAEWFERAAGSGNVQAQYNLGVMLRQGLGVPKDLNGARKWLGLAAKENHPEAQKILAEVFAQDDQGNPDYFAAAQWFERAAEQGVIDAQFNVALMYSGGLGVEPDQVKAYRWFGIAGRNGDQEAKREQQKVGAGLSSNDRAGLDREIAAWQPKKMWTPPPNKWLAASGGDNVSAEAILTRRDQIKKVQQLLLAYGYDPGTPDGLPGSRTQRAIREWQRDNNLLVDGRLTGNVLNRLQKDQ